MGRERVMTAANGLGSRCDLLRSLHRPGAPLVLPNAWDAATARAVAEAGFPAVATTSAGVAAALGYEDHEGAPSGEMLAAAARITRSVDVPVTVDAEAGYGMTAAELVAELRGMGAAGCNLEDTNHAAQTLRDPAQQAAWLRAARQAASDQRYRLVINARIDVFLPSAVSGSVGRSQGDLVPEGLRRAQAYLDAGADCVYPIGLWEAGALAAFVSACPGPVNVLRIPRAPSSLAELAGLGVARVSYASLLHRGVMEQFSRVLSSLAAEQGEHPYAG
jgi:2-methylisocitrate lyase-like PEP mutase family enzyme